MSTTPEQPVEDDSYPEHWKPRERRQLDGERREFELAVAALPDEELNRIRPMTTPEQPVDDDSYPGHWKPRLDEEPDRIRRGC